MFKENNKKQALLQSQMKLEDGSKSCTLARTKIVYGEMCVDWYTNQCKSISSDKFTFLIFYFFISFSKTIRETCHVKKDHKIIKDSEQ